MISKKKKNIVILQVLEIFLLISRPISLLLCDKYISAAPLVSLLSTGVNFFGLCEDQTLSLMYAILKSECSPDIFYYGRFLKRCLLHFN